LKTKPVGLALAISAAFGCAQAQSVQTLDPVVVTASKFEEPQGQATAIVDVIDRQQIEQSGAANVTELLDQVSGGLLTRQYGRLGADASFDLGYLGGASVQRTLVLVDGVRMNDIDGATIRWGQVPLDAIERIEVRKAGGGVLFGDRALGGVVNLITKRAPGTSSATITLGSFGTRVVGVQTAKQVSDTSLQLAAQQAKTDGYREDADQTVKSLQMALSQRTSAGVFSFDLRSAYENVNQPSAITLASFQANPRSTNYGLTRSKRRGINSDLHWDYAVSADVDIRARWSKESSISQAWNLYENDRDTFEASTVARLRQLRLIAGIEYFDAESASSRSQRASVTQTSSAGYVNAETPIRSSILNLGVRQQRMENQFFNTTASPAEQSVENLSSWSLGGLTPLQGVDLRYSLQSSFAFPHADQLFTYQENSPYAPVDINPGVRAMKSREAQVSIDKQLADTKVKTGIRHILVADEIGEQLNCAGVGISCNTNLYDTKRSIAFLEGAGKLTSRWSWKASVDRIHAKIDSGDNQGNLVPMVPNLVVRASLAYQSTAGRFQLLANHRGKMVRSEDNANSASKIPERVLFDAGYSLASKGQELSVWIRNLADHQYFDFAQTWGVAPADGRSVEVRFKQTF
jgi:iron complex outermembrane receptor protein